MNDKRFTQHELRIGSYVTSKTWGGMHQVNAISFNRGMLIVNVNNYDHIAKDGIFAQLRAIPLTSCVLKKFGFQPSENCDTLYFLEVTSPRLGNLCKLTYDIVEDDFQYLHQLQDYIYVQTGVMIKATE